MNEIRRLIPIVIITSLTNDEFYVNWGQKSSYGIWISGKSALYEFKELKDVYVKKVTDWQEFVDIPFNVPEGEIIALVLNGCPGNNLKPHQFEILWRLFIKEGYEIGFILVHPGGNQKLKEVIKREYFFNGTLKDRIKFSFEDSKPIQFKEDNKTVEILLIEYSLGGNRTPISDWIDVISKAVRVGSMRCAVDRLKKLAGLLDKDKENNFNGKVFNDSPPKSCYIYEMISWLPNLFLDLLIDSTGLWEIVDGISSPTERRAKAVELRSYLESMIKDKSTGPFRQKLADARYLAFGETYGTGTLICNGDKTGGSVPEKPSESVVKNFEKENLNEMLNRYDLKDTGKKLAEHLGLKQNENNLHEDPDHSILKFLCAWDCLMEKGLENVYDDSIFSIVDFHQEYSDWYDQLVEITDRLKKQIR
jgi:hypothetical protein